MHHPITKASLGQFQELGLAPLTTKNLENPSELLPTGGALGSHWSWGKLAGLAHGGYVCVTGSYLFNYGLLVTGWRCSAGAAQLLKDFGIQQPFNSCFNSCISSNTKGFNPLNTPTVELLNILFSFFSY
jgi:hypothetical protein